MCATQGVSVFCGDWGGGRGLQGRRPVRRWWKASGTWGRGTKHWTGVGRDGGRKSCRVGGGWRDTQGSPFVIKLCSVLADGLCLQEGGHVDMPCDLGLSIPATGPAASGCTGPPLGRAVPDRGEQVPLSPRAQDVGTFGGEDPSGPGPWPSQVPGSNSSRVRDVTRSPHPRPAPAIGVLNEDR